MKRGGLGRGLSALIPGASQGGGLLEIPVAAVRLVEGATFDEVELKKWADERMSDYKVPRRIIAVDDLPRTGTNKVQRRELLSLFRTSPS